MSGLVARVSQLCGSARRDNTEGADERALEVKKPVPRDEDEEAEFQKRLGVLRLDNWGDAKTTGTGDSGYVPLPGDIDSKDSYKYPLIAEIVKDMSFEFLCDPVAINKAVEDDIRREVILKNVAEAVEKLIKRGAHAIIANCGLFMWLHTTGLIDIAVDRAVNNLAASKPQLRRPVVALSSITMMGSMLATIGVGPQAGTLSRELGSETAKAAIFTSNGNSCKEVLKDVLSLKGVKMFMDGEQQGEVLIVGLDSGLAGLVPEFKPDNGILPGFEAVKSGTPVVFQQVQAGMLKLARAIKKKYPSILMAIVECTEVSAYSDTIRSAMNVGVFDPINLANSSSMLTVDHNFEQKTAEERLVEIKVALGRPLKGDLAQVAEELKSIIEAEKEHEVVIVGKKKGQAQGKEELKKAGVDAPDGVAAAAAQAGEEVSSKMRLLIEDAQDLKDKMKMKNDASRAKKVCEEQAKLLKAKGKAKAKP